MDTNNHELWEKAKAGLFKLNKLNKHNKLHLYANRARSPPLRF